MPGGLAVLLLAARAHAVPAYLQLFKARYHPRAASCLLCHTDHAGGKVNEYGRAFVRAGATAEAFAAIEHADPDGDGAPSLTEIRSGSNPGDPASTPRAPGTWLTAATLADTVPLAALARMFPGAGRFEVREAVLSDADMRSVGRALGSPLTRSDRYWTLYFPVDTRAKPPVRTGIGVFPAASLKAGLFLGSVALGPDGKVASAWGGIFGDRDRTDLSALAARFTGKTAGDPLTLGRDLAPAPGPPEASVDGARELRKALLVVTRLLAG